MKLVKKFHDPAATGALTQPPELPVKAELREERLGFVSGVAAPVRGELSRVPRVGQSRCLLKREDVGAGESAAVPPRARVFFRPEEQHRGSSEVDVIPELARRHSDVKKGTGPRRRVTRKTDVDVNRFPAVATVRVDCALCAERGCDA